MNHDICKRKKQQWCNRKYLFKDVSTKYGQSVCKKQREGQLRTREEKQESRNENFSSLFYSYDSSTYKHMCAYRFFFSEEDKSKALSPLYCLTLPFLSILPSSPKRKHPFFKIFLVVLALFIYLWDPYSCHLAFSWIQFVLFLSFFFSPRIWKKKKKMKMGIFIPFLVQ